MKPARFALLALAAASLSACATADRLAHVGSPPPLTPIDNPALYAGGPRHAPAGGIYAAPAHQAAAPGAYAAPASAPAHYPSARADNSLWEQGSRTFFGDPRANRAGDILTININIDDSARLQNSTGRTRTSAENSNLTNFLGGEAVLSNFFNDAIDPASLTSFGSTSSMAGNGSVNRREAINLSVAAVVSQILPNGNLVIAGRQEVRINNEVRELLVTGVVRPEDIASDNTIRHTQIAEARISYGGRGHLTDVQRPRLGHEIYDILWPF